MDTVVSNLIGGILAIVLAVVYVLFVETGMLLKIWTCTVALIYALYGFLRALYLHLLHSRKGRDFLKKIPIQKIQSEATMFYDEEE